MLNVVLKCLAIGAIASLLIGAVIQAIMVLAAGQTLDVGFVPGAAMFALLLVFPAFMFALLWLGLRQEAKNNPTVADRSQALSTRQVGFLLVGSSVLVCLCLSRRLLYGDWQDWWTFRGRQETVQGHVTASFHSKRWSFIANSRSGSYPVDVWEVRYEAPSPQGELIGTSFLSGVRGPAVGSTVTIEHPSGRWDVSRIAGLRSTPYETTSILVWVGACFGAGAVLLAADAMKKKLSRAPYQPGSSGLT